LLEWSARLAAAEAALADPRQGSLRSLVPQWERAVLLEDTLLERLREGVGSWPDYLAVRYQRLTLELRVKDAWAKNVK
jgi:hypothetical protein